MKPHIISKKGVLYIFSSKGASLIHIPLYKCYSMNAVIVSLNKMKVND